MNNWSLIPVALAILIAGCSSNPKSEDETGGANPDRASVFKEKDNPLAARRKETRDAKLDAEQLYRRARGSLDSSDYAGAIEAYDNLSKRHPFSDFTTQGELERLYALYRNFDNDKAQSSAERFLREHPRHAAVDYVYYLKGLINYDRDATGLAILPNDETKSDVTSQRRAFDDFALLIQKFPNSRFAGDAYKRMVYVRNRLASHELHVVDFYVRRGAYVAAAKRAEQVIAQYPGTPASYKALDALVQCYELAGLEQQARDARSLLAAQDPKLIAVSTSSSVASDAPPAPVTAAAPEAAPETAPKKGLLARIAGAFNPFDNDGVEIIIPSAPPEASATGRSAAEAEAAAAATAAPSPAEAAPTTSNKLEVFYEPYDQAPAETEVTPPSSAPAAPGSDAK